MDNIIITLILWTIIYILNFIAYNRSPINYSNDTFLGVSYNIIYYIIAIIILFVHIYYLLFLTETYIDTYLCYIPLIIGFLIINMLKPKKIEDKNKFFLPSQNVSKNLSIIYILLLTCLAISFMITKNKQLIILISIYALLYLFFLNFAPCKYSLPNTF
jgi:hypothetical protein